MLVLIAILLLARLHLVFRLNLNWDEFHYLSYVYEHRWGELSRAWQTFHVHLFGWLSRVPGHEVGQLFVARSLLWLSPVVCAALTYAIGRRLLDRTAALFAPLCYLSITYLIEHGTSFRPDTLSAPIALGGLYLVLTRRSPRAMALAGALFALALLITIKSVLYVAVAGLIWCLRWLAESDRRRSLLRAAAVLGLALIVVFALLWSWHGSSLAPAEEGSNASFLQRSAAKVFLTHGFFPRWPYFARTLRWDALAWGLIAAGALVALRDAALGPAERRRRGLTLLVLALPLATLLVYRNAFPYFYVFILSPPVLLAGLAFERLLASAGTLRSRLPAILAAVLVATLGIQGIAHSLRHAQDQNRDVKALLDAVHRAFPEPVPYIDRCSMVATFPKVGFFMSTWGLESYLAAGEPILRELLETEQPRFLIANVPSLWFFLPDELTARLRYPLLPQDRAALRDNFVEHWGLLFVAGKRLELGAGAGVERFEILISGPYTLEAPGAVVIDGAEILPGEVVELSQGVHEARSPAGSMRLVLRWGDHLYRPPPPARPQRLFRDF